MLRKDNVTASDDPDGSIKKRISEKIAKAKAQIETIV